MGEEGKRKLRKGTKSEPGRAKERTYPTSAKPEAGQEGIEGGDCAPQPPKLTACVQLHKLSKQGGETGSLVPTIKKIE